MAVYKAPGSNTNNAAKKRTAPVKKLAYGLLAQCFATSFCFAQQESSPLQGRTLADGEFDYCFEVNRPWLESNPLPPDRPWLSEYVEVYDIVQERLQKIVFESDESFSVSANVSHLYQSYSNIERRNTLGVQALAHELEIIEEMRTPEDVARIIARFNRLHSDRSGGTRSPVPAPFSIDVWPDSKNSNRELVHLLQSGLSLPDKSYYLDDNASLIETRGKFREHITKIFTLANTEADISNIARTAADVLEVETKLAKLQWNLTEQQDVRERSRQFSIDELERFAPDFKWRIFFKEAAIASDIAIALEQPSFVRSAAQMLVTLPADKLRAYFRWQLLQHYANYLSEPFGDATFDFYGKELSGLKAKPSFRQSAMELLRFQLEDELSLVYLERYFPSSMKVKAQAIAENVRRAYIERIDKASWLASTTRDEAKRKLTKMRVEIAYPDRTLEPPSVTLQSDELIENLMRLSQRDYEGLLKKLTKPTDRQRWWNSPLGFGGSYSTSRTMLIISAGRLQAPLFSVTASDAENYGGLGTLIGHEMGHALDNQGSEYDADGNVRDWWTQEDRQEFARRTEQLAKQYSRYQPLPGMLVDGDATLSENIADLAGLTIGYHAFELAMKDQSKVIAVTDQRTFFESWARRWRVQYNNALLTLVLKSDSHPPLQYRCTAPLANFSLFYEAIDIEETNPAYIVPENRVTVW